MDIQITKLASSDLNQFRQLVTLFSEVFEMENFQSPSPAHLQNTLNMPGFMAFVAIVSGELAGGMTVYTLDSYYAEKPLAYIFDLAVLPKYQRMKIGTRLINYVKDYCRSEGYEEVFVQADTVDEYALKFYRSTGITEEEDVRHFYYTL